MARVNVFLNDELLDEINREAEAEETNRSAFIQTALEEYLRAKKRQREEEEKCRKMQQASLKLDALAKKLGAWDAQAIIRSFRDRNRKDDA
ncbi:MAG TPA: ribbon-helix-helix protein, CopG family [Candidatus Binatia bacterium]